MSQAARVGDFHSCPVIINTVPHVGGPITGPGVPSVLIGGQPAATVGDFASCVGSLDTIIQGSATVLIGDKPAARQGDNTAHGGVIIQGCANVIIG